jgi:transposase
MSNTSTTNNLKKEKAKAQQNKNALGYIDPTVSGIDIGDKLIHVAIPDGKGGAYVKEFGTTTPDLHNIVQTLKQAKVETGVMEATGVYWIPLYEIMEDSDLKPVLVDAKNVKNPPGRKTDVVDAQWIQTLYSAGLLRAAYRPPRDRLTLRAYIRQRINVIEQKQIALLHMEKALQLMNIKLSTVTSDIAGVSGLNIIRGILAGEKDPKKLAALRNKFCKQEETAFVAALSGNYQAEHIFSLKQAVESYDFSHTQLDECDSLIKIELEKFPDVEHTAPPQNHKDKNKQPKFANLKKPKKNEFSFDVRAILWRKSGIDLTALPGVAASTALLIYAELGGTDVSAWRSEKAFSSWLKLSPGNNVSGGKRRKSKRQKPNTSYISQALRMSALSAKKSDTSLGAFIRRTCGRTDNSRGIKAGAHKLAISIYQMCKNGWLHHEKGAEHNERMHAEKALQGLHKKAKLLGYRLVLENGEVGHSAKK